MEGSQAAPVLSTPSESFMTDSAPALSSLRHGRLSDKACSIQYEIQRTVDEIRAGKWKRIALQFPDEMLQDAPRVYDKLRDRIKVSKRKNHGDSNIENLQVTSNVDDLATRLRDASLEGKANGPFPDAENESCQEESFTILGDTSYGACCVDEIAAEHVAAEVVVHYGRSCLSPTARLPVIYVFTDKPLDLEATVTAFAAAYEDKREKISLMADVPYHHHLSSLAQRLHDRGYEDLFIPEVIHDPASLLPNRTLPPEVHTKPEVLRDYSIFHIGAPPTALLLTLSSRVKRIHIYDPTSVTPSAALESTSRILLRRRYAALLRLSSAEIIGILINTLSVRNFLTALSHVQSLITAAGKKSYTIVVGKLNPAKLANFAEIGGWVVIGCWESSLVDSKDFLAPVVTPFELEVALAGDEGRVWGGEWVSDFQALLARQQGNASSDQVKEGLSAGMDGRGDGYDEASDDEPPEFDLRTGRYVSHARPMRRPKPVQTPGRQSSSAIAIAPPSSALVQRARGDVAMVNGTVAPGAEYLRSRRTWQGLGSDHEIAYDRDEEGKIQGAAMEEGRSGLARSYAVETEESRR